MQKLVERLIKNGVVEEYDGPWGELVVLATKPHQETFPVGHTQALLVFVPWKGFLMWFCG